MTAVAVVNSNAAGVWSQRVGEHLTIVGPGANCHHVMVSRDGERRSFGMPTKWLDRLDVEEEHDRR